MSEMAAIETRGAKTIRLACVDCDRSDKDGITADELSECVRLGWAGVRRYQSYEDSVRAYDDPAEAPPGYSVLDWFTHLGTCPECVVTGEAAPMSTLSDLMTAEDTLTIAGVEIGADLDPGNDKVAIVVQDDVGLIPFEATVGELRAIAAFFGRLADAKEVGR
jgi:hypothetical protein